MTGDSIDGRVSTDRSDTCDNTFINSYTWDISNLCDICDTLQVFDIKYVSNLPTA